MLLSRVLAVSGLFALVAACAPAQQSPAPATSGGQAPASSAAQPFTLRVGTASLQANLDSHAIIGLNPRRYGIWEAIVNQDENGKVVPGVATEWKNVNPTTWQFKLNPNKKFSDGNAVTAEDVVYSWTRVVDPANKLGVTGRVGTVERAEKVDAQTVNIITKSPDGLFLKRAAAVAIMEKAIVEKAVPADLAVKATGTGAYMVKEFVSNDHLTLVPNPYYEPKPQATEVLIRQIPEPSARIAGLRTGELDLIQNVPTTLAESVKSTGAQIVNFNMGSSYGGIIFTNQPNQPTQNVLVRQAMNYAIDKDAIAKNVYGGYTQATGQMIQKTTFGYDPNIKPYPYDVSKAKSLLAQAGYPNGFNIKIAVYATSAEATALFLYVQDAFRAIGINVEIESATDPQFNTDRFYGRVARPQILSQSLSNGPALDADFAISWFSSKRPEAERWFASPAFDAAYDASTSELDEAKRLALLQKAIGILHDEAPFLFVADNFSLWAASPDIKNVIVRGDSEPRYELVTKG